VFIVNSQEFGQLGDFHCSVPGFEFLYQIETHAASSVQPSRIACPLSFSHGKPVSPILYCDGWRCLNEMEGFYVLLFAGSSGCLESRNFCLPFWF
jgi:hypothetical protein